MLISNPIPVEFIHTLFNDILLILKYLYFLWENSCMIYHTRVSIETAQGMLRYEVFSCGRTRFPLWHCTAKFLLLLLAQQVAKSRARQRASHRLKDVEVERRRQSPASKVDGDISFNRRRRLRWRLVRKWDRYEWKRKRKTQCSSKSY